MSRRAVRGEPTPKLRAVDVAARRSVAVVSSHEHAHAHVGARVLRDGGACEEVIDLISGPFGASLVARVGGQG
ncbi:MAG TPA: hypothetical protein PKU97_18385 [Kofleriaceae bacterium]|nr:hypothetical protein [Kofleriaceae bacterium]